MTQRERQSYTVNDPASLLDEPTYSEVDEDDDESGLFTGELLSPVHESRAERRAAERRRSDRHHNRRGGRLLAALTATVVVLVVVLAAVLYPKLRDHFSTPDYSGNGTGAVSVVVGSGDSAADIAGTLAGAGVVKSSKAFVKAADADPSSQGIQAGTYTLRKHMSGAAALALLLDPSARGANSNLVVFEGANVIGVQDRLVKVLGDSAKPAIEKAIKDVANSGVPLGYAPDGTADGVPTSVEGFLYPATYNVTPGESPADLVQKMTGAFIAQDRSSGFALAAVAAGVTPYQALIIASIAQSEAKFPQDMPKVVRVILNRLKSQTPLKTDAATVYGAELKGLSKKDINVSTYDTPYNTYKHAGLPPTPISNPGADALNAAVHPAVGTWMYYVNGTADGHLSFFNDETDFLKAAKTCADKNWGCG